MEKEIKKLEQEIRMLKAFIERLRTEADIIVSGEKKGKNKKLLKRLEELEQMISRDELMGTLNRRGFYDRFKYLFEEALFAKDSPDLRKQMRVSDFSIIFLDIDDFKKINDTYGHDEGDNVLKSFAELLKKAVRSIDGVARFGGEELVIALVGANEDVAFAKAEEIKNTISKEVRLIEYPDHTITASLGVASLGTSDADDLDELIGYADQAMYEAKTNRGKNCVVKHSEIA